MARDISTKTGRQPLELVAVERHVRHEFTAFNVQLHALLLKPPPDQPLRIALYEAAMVHLRALCDFFSPPANWQDDDILSTDYGAAAQVLPPVLEQARHVANKQIVHLTYERNGLPEDGQTLPWTEIRDALETLVEGFSWTAKGTPVRLDFTASPSARANLASTQVSATTFHPCVNLPAKKI